MKKKRLSIDIIAKCVKTGSTAKNAIVLTYDGSAEEGKELVERLRQENVKCELIENGDGSNMVLISSVKGKPENKKIKKARKTKGTPNTGEGGHWEKGSKGNGLWVPEGEPGKFNKDNETWENNLKKKIQNEVNEHRKRNGMEPDFKFKGVEFKDDVPDFEPFSFGKVEVNAYSSDRNVNYALANEMMACQLTDSKGREYTPKEVKKWMKNHNPRMTWHESADGKTMMKVPSVVHGNVSHSGGVNAINLKGAAAVEKKKNSRNDKKTRVI